MCTATPWWPPCGSQDRAGSWGQHTRTFATTTAGITALGDWLAEHRVTRTGMESTGVYWKPVYYLLEDQLEVWLINAEHLHNVPGRKTDVADSAWIAQMVWVPRTLSCHHVTYSCRRPPSRSRRRSTSSAAAGAAATGAVRPGPPPSCRSARNCPERPGHGIECGAGPGARKRVGGGCRRCRQRRSELAVRRRGRASPRDGRTGRCPRDPAVSEFGEASRWPARRVNEP